jgi:hypothetical protein
MRQRRHHVNRGRQGRFPLFSAFPHSLYFHLLSPLATQEDKMQGQRKGTALREAFLTGEK